MYSSIRVVHVQMITSTGFHRYLLSKLSAQWGGGCERERVCVCDYKLTVGETERERAYVHQWKEIICKCYCLC